MLVDTLNNQDTKRYDNAILDIIKIQRCFRYNRIKKYISANIYQFNNMYCLKNICDRISAEKYLSEQNIKKIYIGFIDKILFFINKKTENIKWYRCRPENSIAAFYIYNYPESIDNMYTNRTKLVESLVELSYLFVESFISLINRFSINRLDTFVDYYVYFSNCFVVCNISLEVEDKRQTFDKIIQIHKSLGLINKKNILKDEKQYNRVIKNMQNQIDIYIKNLGLTEKDINDLKEDHSIRYIDIDFIKLSNLDNVVNTLTNKLVDENYKIYVLDEINRLKQKNRYVKIVYYLKSIAEEVSEYCIYQIFFDRIHKKNYNI